MRFLEVAWDFIKGLSPLKLALLIISPFTLSLLIHITILAISAYTTWYIPKFMKED